MPVATRRRLRGGVGGRRPACSRAAARRGAGRTAVRARRRRSAGRSVGRVGRLCDSRAMTSWEPRASARWPRPMIALAAAIVRVVVGESKREAAHGLHGATDHEQRRAASVGHPAERDRQEDRQQRERRGDEPDLTCALTVSEQPIGGRRSDQVDRGLRDAHREQREEKPPGQRATPRGGAWPARRTGGRRTPRRR